MRVLKSAVSSIGTRSSCVSLVWILNIAVAWCCRRWTCDPPFPCAVPTVKPVITKVEAKSSTSIQVTWEVSTLRVRRQLFSVQNLCTAAWCAAWSTVPRNTARDFGEKSGVSNSLAYPCHTWCSYHEVAKSTGSPEALLDESILSVENVNEQWCKWRPLSQRDADFHRCEYRGQHLWYAVNSW